MDDETAFQFPNERLSSTTFNRNFNKNDNADNEVDDPISAYFKQRCGDSNKSYFRKQVESDSDSSVGLIDVENVSLFGDREEGNFRLTRNSVEFESKNANDMGVYSSPSKTLISDTESQLMKQRVLAQKALMKLNTKINETETDILFLPEKSIESNALIVISNKSNSEKPSVGCNENSNWFQPNYCPDTPRYFNDELSSLGGEDSLPSRDGTQAKEPSKDRQSQYAKKLNSMLKDFSQFYLNPDIEFKSCTKEEQINKLEEDEKKFKLENSGVLHNSGISQFSGVVGEEIGSWAPESEKPEQETQKLSIGQFFNMRSNRVSSLVGSAGDEKSLVRLEQDSESSTLIEFEMQKMLRNEYSLPICDSTNVKKENLRRCASTCDLVPKTKRRPNDSCSSNTTLMIQNLLAEMESGLSGTQIYEKLMKSYGKNNEKKKDKVVELKETPKSSKASRGKCREMSSKGKEREETGVDDESRRTPTLPLDVECKENKPENLKLRRNERIKKVKNRKGFDASTPKIQVFSSQSDKFRSDRGKIFMRGEDWEAPRVSSIRAAMDLNRSGFSEENDKTVTEPNKNGGMIANDTLTIEDTIVAGDLTVLSQRIDEMKEDGMCIVRSSEPEEPVLLRVVQKLAHLPIGSIDCSALTPLLRDQFPELLSTFPMTSKNSFNGSFFGGKTGDFLATVPGSWVKLPEVVGLCERISACAEVEQTVFIPVTNISTNWLLVSIESFGLIHSSGRKLTGVRKNEKWVVLDFVTGNMKETVVPPNSQQSLRVAFRPEIPTKLDIKVTLSLKNLLRQAIQSRSFLIRAKCINPLNNIDVTPKECIDFGTIADQCYDSRVIHVSFDGVCELPLMVYVKENESRPKHFLLKPCGDREEVGWNEDKFHHVFHKGEKQVLEFRVFFQPNTLLNSERKNSNFTGCLIFKIGTETESDGILKKIPIKSSVAFAKFLCNPSCTPLVFRASEKGQPVSRSYPVKNVGVLPIAFSLNIINRETETEQQDSLFTAPKYFYLSVNEESAINITFSANTSQHFTKRFLILQMQPNGRVMYDVELIGVMTPSGSKAFSQASAESISTKSISEWSAKPSTPIKLLTTAQSLSWTAVPLEKEVKQSLQLKNAYVDSISVRLSFREDSDSFKLVNEDGEKVKKIRKVLKGDCPYVVTVAFSPDLVGPHHNALFIQINSSSRKKMIKLNGIGGMPNIYMGNVKSDLNGCKILTLQNSSSDNQFYFTSLVFKNEGRTPGFILIKPSMEVLSLSHELVIAPSRCVIMPNSKVVVKLSHRLKSGELKFLLSGKDISKLASLSVTMGDELSRLRMRKLLESGRIASSERLKILISAYQEEKEMNLKLFEDGPGLENQFFKSLKTVEVAVVVERSSGICEPTILEDADETLDNFVTVISAPDNTDMPTPNSPSRSNSSDCNATSFFSEPLTSHNKITKWLETLEFPSET